MSQVRECRHWLSATSLELIIHCYAYSSHRSMQHSSLAEIGLSLDTDALRYLPCGASPYHWKLWIMQISSETGTSSPKKLLLYACICHLMTYKSSFVPPSSIAIPTIYKHSHCTINHYSPTSLNTTLKGTQEAVRLLSSQ